MEILRVTMVNNQARVWCLGDTDLIPGKKADVDKTYLKHPDVADAIKKGHLTVVDGGADEGEETVDIDSMTVDQLKAYAVEQKIDLGAAAKKEEILAAIKAAQAQG